MMTRHLSACSWPSLPLPPVTRRHCPHPPRCRPPNHHAGHCGSVLHTAQPAISSKRAAPTNRAAALPTTQAAAAQCCTWPNLPLPPPTAQAAAAPCSTWRPKWRAAAHTTSAWTCSPLPCWRGSCWGGACCQRTSRRATSRPCLTTSAGCACVCACPARACMRACVHAAGVVRSKCGACPLCVERLTNGHMHTGVGACAWE